MAKKILLTIKESTTFLKQLFHKHPHHIHARIQMLYYIQSNTTDVTKALAEKLMVSVPTIQGWKNAYSLGGLENLLKYERGKNKSNGAITPEINKIILEQLSSPTSAFSSYVDLHQWIKENHLENVSYRVVHRHAHTKLKASLKIARKSHIKKDAAVVDLFKKT